MTRAQRRAHAIVFQVLAAVLLLAIGYALARRRLTSETESASIGRVVVHDAPSATPGSP